MVDAIIPVAFAVHVSPKRYALLIGAGISISAGLPSATAASANMIKEIAKARGESIEGSEDALVCLEWFNTTFGEPPTFDLLMNKLGISEKNRTDGLRRFIFTVDDSGKPIPITPTPAHRAIAELVKEGYISIIITTNFDPLIEDSIKDATGILPQVITSETDRALMSVFPDKCRVVKVNGDFTSKHLKITPEDLKSYDPEIESYINRIASEYGLIVCGWSGEYDTRLVEILQELEGLRYPTFWVWRSNGKIPKKLSEKLLPTIVPIETADEFFTSIQTVISRLKIIERDQPLPLQVAIRKVTDALRQPRPEIVLRELIQKETDLVLDEIARFDYVPIGKFDAQDVFISRIGSLEKATASLAAMLGTITFYDDSHYQDLIYDAIERLINVSFISPFANGRGGTMIGFPSGTSRYNDCLYDLRLLPALLVIYSTGIAAVKAVHLNMLDAVLEPRMHMGGSYTPRDVSYMYYVSPLTVLGCSDLWVELTRKLFTDSGNIFTYSINSVYKILNHLIPSRDRYIQSYDNFEYLFGLAYLKCPIYNVTDESLRRERFPALDSRLSYSTFRNSHPGKMIIPQHIADFTDQIKKMIQDETAVGRTVFFGKIEDYRSCESEWLKLFGVSEHPE